MSRINGTVKWFSSEKGYGFITDEDSNDYFAHASEIQTDAEKTLNNGDEVTFESIEGTKGSKATKIKIAN